MERYMKMHIALFFNLYFTVKEESGILLKVLK